MVQARVPRKKRRPKGAPAMVTEEEIKQRLRDRRRAESERFDEWFDHFDAKDAAVLDREELVRLCLFLQPEHPPAPDTVDRLLHEAAAAGENGAPATREQLRAVVLKNLARGARVAMISTVSAGRSRRRIVARRTDAPRRYIKEAKLLDGIFERFDEDRSGGPARHLRGSRGRQATERRGAFKMPRTAPPDVWRLFGSRAGPASSSGTSSRSSCSP